MTVRVSFYVLTKAFVALVMAKLSTSMTVFRASILEVALNRNIVASNIRSRVASFDRARLTK